MLYLRRRSRMANFAKLVVGLLLAASGTCSFALYASLSPPAGWTSGGGAGGSYNAATTAISNAQASSRFTTGVTKVGAGMQFASGASRFAARALLGGGVASLGLAGAAWLLENCFKNEGGQWVRTCGGSAPPVSDGFEYKALDSEILYYQSSPALAGAVYVDFKTRKSTNGSTFELATCGGWQTGECQYLQKWQGQTFGPYGIPMDRRSNASCPAGWYVTPAGCVQTVPPSTVTPRQIEDELATKPMPAAVPGEVGIPLPIDMPTITPWREPSGNPRPIPNTNPKRYEQPWTEVKPSPTAGNPWRVEVSGSKTETSDGTAQTGPQPVPTEGSGVGTPAEKEPELDLCEKHPDILACQELDKPDSGELETKDVGGPITPDGGWGASTAACPTARHITVQGRDIPIPYDLFCQYMSGLRPIIIAMAWLAAAFIFVGGIKGND